MVAILAGCGGATSSTAATAGADETNVRAAIAPEPDPLLRVLDVGAAPRRALQLRLRPGTTETMEIGQALRVVTDIDGRRAENTVRYYIAMRVDVLAVRADGQATVAYTVDHADIEDGQGFDPTVRAKLVGPLSEMAGLRSEGQLSPHGTWSDIGVSVPPGVSAEARKQFDQLHDSLGKFAARLPSQPVGVGARWSASNGNTASPDTARFRYMLVALDDREARIGIESELAPRAPPPKPATVEDHRASMTATSTVRLDRVVWDTTAKVVVDVRMAMQGDDGKPRRLAVHTDLDISIGPAKHRVR